MFYPFHLSFAVPDLEATKIFYLNILGCDSGTVHDTWLNINFYGHQLTLHQASDYMPAKTIDHFGPIIDKETWLVIAQKCRSNKISFELPPTTLHANTTIESGKYIIKDPAGNRLEFKYYTDT